MIIATTLLVFIDRLILNVPTMATWTVTQHFKRSNIFIPESMGSVVCYRWFKI